MGRRLLLLLIALGLSACRSSVDPDQGRFSCDTDADCGSGYECIAQASGGKGRCFRLGECVPEQCSGRDEDCDGLTDESFPEQGEACVTSLPGVCRDGRKTCDGGQVACAPITPARTEACDGLDDDCDGSADEDFDLSTDPLHCGGCGRACPSGTSCAASECREVSCADGLDDDGDGRADCEDEDCRGLPCSETEPELNCGLAWPDGGEADAGGPDAGSPDAGELDGGEVDGGEPDSGTPGVCVPREALCGDGADDDGDGRGDCADLDCEGRPCDAGTCVDGGCA